MDYFCTARDLPLRGVAHLRRDIESGRAEATKANMAKLEAAEAALQRREALVTGATRTRDMENVNQFTEEDAAALRPFLVARNRWHLAVTLLRNPSIMKYREFRLPKSPVEEAEDLSEELGDDEKPKPVKNPLHGLQNWWESRSSQGDTESSIDSFEVSVVKHRKEVTSGKTFTVLQV